MGRHLHRRPRRSLPALSLALLFISLCAQTGLGRFPGPPPARCARRDPAGLCWPRSAPLPRDARPAGRALGARGRRVRECGAVPGNAAGTASPFRGQGGWIRPSGAASCAAFVWGQLRFVLQHTQIKGTQASQ